MNQDFIVDKSIINIFVKNKVVLAFLFGSVTKGKINKLSDLDIGVVLDQSIAPEKYYQTRIALLDKIGRIYKNRPIDLAILNDANPLLSHLAINRGKVIYYQNEMQKILFQTNNLKKFDDALYLRKTYYHYLSQRVKDNVLGEIYAHK